MTRALGFPRQSRAAPARHRLELARSRVIASGTRLAVAEGWRRGPTGAPVADPAGVDATIRPLLDVAAPNADVQGDIPADVQGDIPAEVRS